MSKPKITICIPTIPPRASLLTRALDSVKRQSLPATAVICMQDAGRQGAAYTREAALQQVTTEWVAFLDDDDEFLPQHLDVLMATAQSTAADYVYSWYHVIGGTDPRPELFGIPFDHCNPVQTTITTLVRTELAQACGFLPEQLDEDLSAPDRHFAGEDWRFTKRVVDAGGYIVHAPYKTWLWHHHGLNTSGLPKNWQQEFPAVSYPVKHVQ